MTNLNRDHVSVDRVIDITRQLVSADTRNPPGNERLAVDIARELLAPLGATFTEFETVTDRTSLLAVLGEVNPNLPTLMFNGHLDVVPINESGWTRSPFGGELDPATNLLYGRGTSDMKGGIASAIEAVHALRAAGIEPPCNLVFHLVADEERGGAVGTKAIVEAGLAHADACIVPEPTGMALCIAERGLVHSAITFYGRPSHGSNPSKGVSAVQHAAAATMALHMRDFNNAPHPLLGSPTANVGVFNGGSGVNTVAEQATIQVDRRLIPGQTTQTSLDELHHILKSLELDNLKYDISLLSEGEPSELDPGHAFIESMRSAVAAVRGVTPELIGMTFTTDARFLRNQAGIPTIVCGPGEVAQAHVDDEFIAVSALVDGALAYAHLIAGFTTAPGA